MVKPSADSGGKPRALLVSPEAAYPMYGGGAIRTASLIEYLAPRYDLDVVFFRESGRPQPGVREGLPARVWTVEIPRHSRSAAAKLVRNARRVWTGIPPLVDRFRGFDAQLGALLSGNQYEIAILEHFWCAPYVELVRPHARRLVLDLHNVESVLHQRAARAGGTSLAFSRWAESCRALERALLPRFDLVLAASPADAALVTALAPAATAHVYPNSIPDTPRPPAALREPIVIFTGNLEYHPNVAAIEYFDRRIWPSVVSRKPNAVWMLAGVNGRAADRRFRGRADVRVIGPIEDAVRQIAEARVAVAPLLSGSGTRLKILEAWAAATPVISTRVGAEGLDVRDGENIVIADTPHAFADAVIELLSNEGTAKQIGCSGRQLYELRYRWPVAWSTLSEVSI